MTPQPEAVVPGVRIAADTRSGADWLERFKPYIEDGKTIVVSPHRVFGPQTNDLVLQLRKRRISKIILGGMLASESHLRDLLEQGLKLWLRRTRPRPLCIPRAKADRV
jgi:hypothetical protein